MALTHKFNRVLDPYNFPVESGDVVKVRTTHPGVAESEKKGQTGRIVSKMEMITVAFEDGTVETFNRDELNLRIPGFDEMGKKEDWESQGWSPNE
jgi:hypothetical protein